jgi:hypothetical protein
VNFWIYYRMAKQPGFGVTGYQYHGTLPGSFPRAAADQVMKSIADPSLTAFIIRGQYNFATRTQTGGWEKVP